MIWGYPYFRKHRYITWWFESSLKHSPNQPNWIKLDHLPQRSPLNIPKHFKNIIFESTTIHSACIFWRILPWYGLFESSLAFLLSLYGKLRNLETNSTASTHPQDSTPQHPNHLILAPSGGQYHQGHIFALLQHTAEPFQTLLGLW